MTDAEYDLHWQRRFTADYYRSEGHADFADRVAAGLADDCTAMRRAEFYQPLLRA